MGGSEGGSELRGEVFGGGQGAPLQERGSAEAHHAQERGDGAGLDAGGGGAGEDLGGEGVNKYTRGYTIYIFSNLYMRRYALFPEKTCICMKKQFSHFFSSIKLFTSSFWVL